MSFQFRPAVRENVPLLIGLAGGTGSGKTYSAMTLAKGLAGDKPFAVIDTESGRARAYADDFRFDVGQLGAPFRPEKYLEAIRSADAAGYPAIVVDSCSHEYAGEGGILDWQEEILASMVQRAKSGGDSRAEWQIAEANKMRAWIEPKMEHKAFVSRLLQVSAHLILCFRAEPKTEVGKDERGKTVIREKQGPTGLQGWFPICEKNMPFELTASFLLLAEQPGVPNPIKLMERHRPFFPPGKPIVEEAGRQLAAWARGNAAHAAAAPVADPYAPESIRESDIPTCDLCGGTRLKYVAGHKAWGCPTGRNHPQQVIKLAHADLVKRLQSRAEGL